MDYTASFLSQLMSKRSRAYMHNDMKTETSNGTAKETEIEIAYNDMKSSNGIATGRDKVKDFLHVTDHIYILFFFCRHVSLQKMKHLSSRNNT